MHTKYHDLMTQLSPSKPLTVGSLSSLAELNDFNSDQTPECDIVEVRLDGLNPKELDDAHWICLRIKSWSMPILITARCKEEGGIYELTTTQRCARLRQFAEVASYADIEIASYPDMKETALLLQQQGIQLILSYHNFEETPTHLEQQLQLALQYKADIPKFAVMHQSPTDLQICADFIQSTDSPISLMGMGILAPVSRLLYAQLGSVLNYGYLGKTPTAPGQWSSKMLKKAICNSSSLAK